MSAAEAVVGQGGEVVERLLPDGRTLRYEAFGPGEWLTKAGAPAKTSRRAYLLDGYELPSVSSIVGTLDKSGALVDWAERVSIEGTIRAVNQGAIDPEWTDEEQAVEIVRDLRYGAAGVRDQAAGRGTAIHAALESLATTGEPPSLGDYPAEWHPWIQGAAKAWLHLNPDPCESELTVVNTSLRYAGRLDLIANIKGRRTLIDHKTGKGRVYDSAHYQSRMYQMALAYSGVEPVEDVLILGIGDDAAFEVMPCQASEEDVVWLVLTYEARKRVNAAMAEHRKIARKAAKA